MPLYAAIGFVTAPGFSNYPGIHFPVLASLLFVLLMWGWILAGLAFLVDRYRVPVLLLVVLWGSFSADHFYKVKTPAQNSSTQWLTPKMVLEKWEANHHADNDPIVVIAAEGGGIQASAWTSRVLAGLEEQFPQVKGGFHSSVLLIRSVSGGSIAAMDYASQYRLGQDGFTKAQLGCMVDRARAGGLEAVGWGVLYPDFLRIASGQAWKLGPFAYADRGSSLQKRWLQIRSQGLGDCPPLYAGEAPTLGDWHGQLSSGEMPAVALNATIVETGQRFLLSNFAFQPDATTNESGPHAVTLHAQCPQCDMDVITAARLSASFTYVSPVSRAFHEDSPSIDNVPAFHLADGGYFDDYGVATAIEWLTSAICPEQGRCPDVKNGGPVRPLILIEIRCCQERKGSKPGSASGSLALSQVAAPLVTLLKVRSTGQAEHNSNLVELFTSAVAGKFDVKHIVVPFQFAEDGEDKCKDSKTTAETLQTPLSWQLTRREQENIDSQWSHLVTCHPKRLDPIVKAFEISTESPVKPSVR